MPGVEKKFFFVFSQPQENEKTYEVLNIPTQLGDIAQLWHKFQAGG